MDGSRDYHTKQSKSGKERQIPYDITHMWTLILKMIQMNLQDRHRFKDIENKLMVNRGEMLSGIN